MFRYRISPETSGYTLVQPWEHNNGWQWQCVWTWCSWFSIETTGWLLTR